MTQAGDEDDGDLPQEADVARFRARLETAALPLAEPHVFIHLPRTAGTSLASAVKLSYGRHAVAQHWFRPTPQQARAAAGKRAIIGHMPWGLHRAWGPHGAWGGCADPTYVTVLREPVARVRSHYHFHRARKDDPNHAFATRLGLTEWVRRAPFASNLTTAWLAGLRHEAWWHAAAIDRAAPADASDDDRALRVTEDHYLRARANLLRCGFVGLTERFGDSLLMMRRFLGMRPVPMPRRNVAAPTAHSEPGEDEAIRAANRWDLELLALARRLFDTQLDVFGGEEALARERARPIGLGVRAQSLLLSIRTAVEGVRWRRRRAQRQRAGRSTGHVR